MVCEIVRRSQLEAQYNARAKMGGAPPPQMGFPPQGAPMYYAPGMPPRNFIYPQQGAMMPRRWNPQQGQPGQPQQMMGVGMPVHRHPGVSYSLMPVAGAQQGRGANQQGMPPNQQGRQGGRVRMH